MASLYKIQSSQYFLLTGKTQVRSTNNNLLPVLPWPEIAIVDVCADIHVSMALRTLGVKSYDLALSSSTIPTVFVYTFSSHTVWIVICRSIFTTLG